jgi:hypothetical protein
VISVIRELPDMKWCLAAETGESTILMLGAEGGFSILYQIKHFTTASPITYDHDVCGYYNTYKLARARMGFGALA